MIKISETQRKIYQEILNVGFDRRKAAINLDLSVRTIHNNMTLFPDNNPLIRSSEQSVKRDIDTELLRYAIKGEIPGVQIPPKIDWNRPSFSADKLIGNFSKPPDNVIDEIKSSVPLMSKLHSLIFDTPPKLKHNYQNLYYENQLDDFRNYFAYLPNDPASFVPNLTVLALTSGIIDYSSNQHPHVHSYWLNKLLNTRDSTILATTLKYNRFSEAGAHLFLSSRTIKNKVSFINRRLGTSDKNATILLAYRLGSLDEHV